LSAGCALQAPMVHSHSLSLPEMQESGAMRAAVLKLSQPRSEPGVDSQRGTAMPTSAIGSSLSGIQTAFARRNASAHNVANVLTEDFKPLRTEQSESPSGGSRAEVRQAEEPREVDLAQEFVSSSVADVQARASLRVLDTELDLVGSIIDIVG